MRSIVFVSVLAYYAILHVVVVDAVVQVGDDETLPTDDNINISDDEKVFLQVPDPLTARSNLKFITREPHVAGTTGDQVMADFVVQAFETAGIPDVSTFDLDVLLNYPHAPPKVTLWKDNDNNNNLNNNNDNDDDMIFDATLSEEILPQDDTSDTFWRNHTFHGYSPSGHVRRAPMIYANYGRPSDFDALLSAGIAVNGTVVLVRYGKCFRGLKVRNAQKLGAVAVLIYSDPADDGYGINDDDDDAGTYPDGAWRPTTGVQRGSVQFNSACAGDPMRADARYPPNAVQDLCGVSSSKDLIPSIPSLPISYGDATPLLQHMGGSLAKEIGGDEFCGGITNLTYRVGPSTNANAVVEVKVQNKDEIRSVPNVIGVIPGTLPPEQDMPVLLGNHRDAWYVFY
jgi:N-acetylated-alpha-linked acidic dipeptidase